MDKEELLKQCVEKEFDRLTDEDIKDILLDGCPGWRKLYEENPDLPVSYLREWSI